MADIIPITRARRYVREHRRCDQCADEATDGVLCAWHAAINTSTAARAQAAAEGDPCPGCLRPVGPTDHVYAAWVDGVLKVWHQACAVTAANAGERVRDEK